MTGKEISVALKDFENDWGKGGKKKRKRDIEDKEMWKKRSIFFDLEYWENHATKEGPTTQGPTTPIVSPTIVNPTCNAKCKLLDWMGTREVVAEGRFSSSDPNALVHHVPIRPNAMRVWVDVEMKHDRVYLWRPTSDMITIAEALGSTVAWPADKVIFASSLE
ncbi:hypothetical protein Vadar_031437 [Vaccinium darrowii]|uniref:Uncharacterized protein n=1 Tax=Vaccinium darrowii TaxID=229202 RepID=A0ACB7YHD4_9ERIC|nr:hypothetical protein Vadar_031437 [Vaccinium darrowii]